MNLEDYFYFLSRQSRYFGKPLDKLSIGEEMTVSFPFLDKHNDYITINFKKLGESQFLMYEESSMDDLWMSLDACSALGKKILCALERIVKGLGVTLAENRCALTLSTTSEDCPTKLTSLIQSVLAVNSLCEIQSGDGNEN